MLLLWNLSYVSTKGYTPMVAKYGKSFALLKLCSPWDLTDATLIWRKAYVHERAKSMVQ